MRQFGGGGGGGGGAGVAREPEWPVGFNPFRPARRRPSDYLMVVAALLIVALLLLWALAG